MIGFKVLSCTDHGVPTQVEAVTTQGDAVYFRARSGHWHLELNGTPVRHGNYDPDEVFTLTDAAVVIVATVCDPREVAPVMSRVAGFAERTDGCDWPRCIRPAAAPPRVPSPSVDWNRIAPHDNVVPLRTSV